MPLVSLLWMADQDVASAGRRGLLQDQDCPGGTVDVMGWSMMSMVDGYGSCLLMVYMVDNLVNVYFEL